MRMPDELENPIQRVFVVVETRAATPEAISHGVYADREDARAVRDRELDDDLHGQNVNVYRESVEEDVHIPDTNPCGCEAEFPEFPDHGVRECQNCGYTEELEDA